MNIQGHFFFDLMSWTALNKNGYAAPSGSDSARWSHGASFSALMLRVRMVPEQHRAWGKGQCGAGQNNALTFPLDPNPLGTKLSPSKGSLNILFLLGDHLLAPPRWSTVSLLSPVLLNTEQSFYLYCLFPKGEYILCKIKTVRLMDR